MPWLLIQQRSVSKSLEMYLDSAFKSAGQRCSALRILLIQDECFDETISMIQGAMLELKLGNPKYLSTDCGPVINADAKTKLQGYIDRLSSQNKVIAGVKNEAQQWLLRCSNDYSTRQHR